MSILDYDIPYALCFSLSGMLEVMATVLVMAVVTWQILIVAVPMIIAVRYYQVRIRLLSRLLDLSLFKP